MKSFNVYRTKGGESVAIKDGVSWPGFFFSWIWALQKGYVVRGLALLLCPLALGSVATRILLGGIPLGGWMGFYAAYLLIASFLTGVSANGWAAERVLTHGGELLQQVEARDAADALKRVTTTP